VFLPLLMVLCVLGSLVRANNVLFFSPGPELWPARSTSEATRKGFLTLSCLCKHFPGWSLAIAVCSRQWHRLWVYKGG
jgi:hypothetical protein